MQWSPCNTCVSTDRSLGFISHLARCLGFRRGTSYNSLYEEAPPKGVSFSGVRYIKRVEILLTVVYERVGKSVI